MRGGGDRLDQSRDPQGTRRLRFADRLCEVLVLTQHLPHLRVKAAADRIFWHRRCGIARHLLRSGRCDGGSREQRREGGPTAEC